LLITSKVVKYMRIDAFNKVSQLYQTNSTKKVANPNSMRTSDKLEISQIGKDIQVAKTAVASTPDIREAKVNDIKQQIASGTYNVQMDDVADKLLDSYFDTSI